MFEEGNIILLHGFIKKTQKAPTQEIEIALKRASNYKSGMKNEKKKKSS